MSSGPWIHPQACDAHRHTHRHVCTRVHKSKINRSFSEKRKPFWAEVPVKGNVMPLCVSELSVTPASLTCSSHKGPSVMLPFNRPPSSSYQWHSLSMAIPCKSRGPPAGYSVNTGIHWALPLVRDDILGYNLLFKIVTVDLLGTHADLTSECHTNFSESWWREDHRR